MGNLERYVHVLSASSDFGNSESVTATEEKHRSRMPPQYIVNQYSPFTKMATIFDMRYVIHSPQTMCQHKYNI